ncbi:hypothetical protein SAMN05421853_101407 [Roseivivax halotolerans]|uniref:DUF4013 domain-containing protein n=1 Tax=Roseivivax halotolerans TaxID=93684 RepID=A0A1I5V9Z6_9RHOB|nr:hypothetical protein [Roseivivax halotolerans]SFQ04343.1 hypothetical protein SAMN05421853_101407 [Roseivivax halotolerans]
MKAWEIFSHSVRLVWRNRRDALRISVALYAIYALVQLVFLEDQSASPDEALQMMEPGQAGTLFLVAILQVVVTLWIAVSWHRFVLLEEYPSGWLPNFHGGSMLKYFGYSLVIGIGVGLAIGVPVTIAAAIAPPLAAIVGLAGLFGAIVLGFRLASVLPAVATGKSLSFGEAWSATKGATGTALGVAAIGVVAALLVQIPAAIVMAVSSLLGTLVFVVINWFVTMVSVSVLTTIYGHFIEGRPID